MASAEPPSIPVVVDSAREAPSMPDVPAHEPQPTEIATNETHPTTFHDAEEESAGMARTTSLFGPFPPAQDNIDHRATTATGSAQKSGMPPTTSIDQVESSKGTQPSTAKPSMPALNFAPMASASISPTSENRPASPKQTTMPALTREKTAPAIGPATDKPTPVPKESEIEGPVLFITLLLTSTGTRHPYKLDEKYLNKRNVIVEDNNPVNISLYKLKELILRDWRDGKKTLL